MYTYFKIVIKRRHIKSKAPTIMIGVSEDSLGSRDRNVIGGDPGNPDFRETDLKMHFLVVDGFLLTSGSTISGPPVVTSEVS